MTRRLDLKSFCQTLLEEFRTQFFLDSSLVFARTGAGQDFEVEGRQDPSGSLVGKERQLLQLLAVLERPTVLLDDEQLLFVAQLSWPSGLQIVCCGRRGYQLRPFQGTDLAALKSFVEVSRKPPASAVKDKLVSASPTRLNACVVANRYARGMKILDGRFSTLYSAFDQVNMTPVLLRKLEASAAVGDQARQARQQLLREGRFLSKLSHENLPRYIETVEDGGDLYLVHEAVSGTTLDKKSKSRELLGGETLSAYLKQFLEVLDFLHHQSPPLIHRDLRPCNILVTTQGTLKLLEFSMARMKESQHDPRPTHFRGLGDPVYAAPEQLLGHASAPSHDIYAVGSILYFLGTGHPPARSTDRWEGTSIEVPLGELRPDLDSLLVHSIEWMRQADPAMRPKSVYDVEVHLDTCR